MTEISKDLGVSLNALINWKKKYLVVPKKVLK
ncbi:hypothetical protein [Leptospira interrogans]|nr:hypothetical protein [Leptospira interrogans]